MDHPLDQALLAYQRALGLGDGKSIIITGGKDFATKTESAGVWVWDTDKNTISEKSSMLSARHKHALVRWDDFIYALGGIGQKGKTIDRCERYSIKNN